MNLGENHDWIRQDQTSELHSWALFDLNPGQVPALMHTLGSFAAKQQVSSHFFGMGVGATKIRLLNVRPGASLQHTLSKPHFEFAAEQDEFTLTNVCAFLHAVHGPLQALAREHEQVEQVPEHSAHTDKHDDAAVQDHLHILHRHV